MPIPAPDRFTMSLGEAIYSMRAIRRFRPKEIEERDLRDILDAARQAPNGGNAQPWRFLLVTDVEKRARLGELYREAWWTKRKDEGINGPEDIPAGKGVRQSAMRLADEIGEAPALVLVCSNSRGEGAAQSVIPSVQNLLLAARAIGVGGTITTLHSIVEERVHQLFDIPAEARVVYCVPLGYPRGRFGPVNRKPLSEVAAVNSWTNTPDWMAT
ncbi:MAG TPA: hypothetical protein DGL25_00750 [Dehalococcoidia bacterium]|nr:hypothetical protein [Dehalococcoidia bacterium]